MEKTYIFILLSCKASLWNRICLSLVLLNVFWRYSLFLPPQQTQLPCQSGEVQLPELPGQWWEQCRRRLRGREESRTGSREPKTKAAQVFRWRWLQGQATQWQCQHGRGWRNQWWFWRYEVPCQSWHCHQDGPGERSECPTLRLCPWLHPRSLRLSWDQAAGMGIELRVPESGLASRLDLRPSESLEACTGVKVCGVAPQSGGQGLGQNLGPDHWARVGRWGLPHADPERHVQDFEP